MEVSGDSEKRSLRYRDGGVSPIQVVKALNTVSS